MKLNIKQWHCGRQSEDMFISPGQTRIRPQSEIEGAMKAISVEADGNGTRSVAITTNRFGNEADPVTVHPTITLESQAQQTGKATRVMVKITKPYMARATSTDQQALVAGYDSRRSGDALTGHAVFTLKKGFVQDLSGVNGSEVADCAAAQLDMLRLELAFAILNGDANIQIAGDICAAKENMGEEGEFYTLTHLTHSDRNVSQPLFDPNKDGDPVAKPVFTNRIDDIITRAIRKMAPISSLEKTCNIVSGDTMICEV